MPEVTDAYYCNAAQAVNKGVSGTDALKATTICILEMSDGSVCIGSATTYDTSDDGERRAAAFARATAAIPPQPEPAAELAPLSGDDTLTGTDSQAGAGDDTISGGAGDDTLGASGGDDTLTSHAGDDTLSQAGGDDTVGGASGADALLASAEALAGAPASK